MTWLSTWPENGIPAYRAHDTEAAAEAHAKEVVSNKRAYVATVFEVDHSAKATQACEIAAQGVARGQVDPNHTAVIPSRQIEGEGR